MASSSSSVPQTITIDVGAAPVIEALTATATPNKPNNANNKPANVPIEALHVLREALIQKLNAADDSHITEEMKKERREMIASMDAGRVAHSIIKDEAADRRLHALAIARRLRYCLPE